MGNSPSTPTSLHLSDGDRPYQVQLGRSAALSFTGRQVEQRGDGEIRESWHVSYKVGDESTCDINLLKIKDIDRPRPEDTTLCIEIYDDAIITPRPYLITISTTKPTDEGSLWHTISEIYSKPKGRHSKDIAAWWPFRPSPPAAITITSRTTNNARGGITDTELRFYGSEPRLGLIVCEWVKKSKDEYAYTGTVAHYYVNKENGQDVGLSVALKRIRMSHDGLWDFSVDGPELHPVDALLYMFKEARRTATWKPTFCPHCANKYILERQFESESDLENVAAPWLYGRRRNPGSIVSNNGMFPGKNNGNTFINNLFNGRS